MRAMKAQTEPLNRLFRGELAAIETYRQALQKVGKEPGVLELIRMENEHRDAADALEQRIIECGGEPASTSGVWGSFAQAAEGAAQLFGNIAALKTLREGEQFGTREYEQAIQDQDFDPESKMLIESNLLPKQRAHVPALDRLIAAYSQ